MSQDITLTAHARERVGKGASRALRREGLVPAIIYGDKKDPLPVALPYKELSILLHSGGFLTTVFNLDVDGKTHRVLPKDYQLEPVRDFIAHVDFFAHQPRCGGNGGNSGCVHQRRYLTRPCSRWGS